MYWNDALISLMLSRRDSYMKKSIFVLFLLFLTISLISCSNKAQPLEDPQVELFEEIYQGEDFSILRQIIMYEGPTYMIAYHFGIGDDTCIIGQIHLMNYMVFYKDKYYNLVEANKFQKISCDLLLELEIISSSD